MEFKELDPILHAPLRLAVISLLLSVKEAEFTFIKEKTNSTAGNLSVQIGSVAVLLSLLNCLECKIDKGFFSFL